MKKKVKPKDIPEWQRLGFESEEQLKEHLVLEKVAAQIVKVHQENHQFDNSLAEKCWKVWLKRKKK